LSYSRLEKTIDECKKQGASVNAQADKYRPDDDSNQHQGGLLGPLLLPSVERLIHVFKIFYKHQ
jgi:parvulin-like peptidyl-prolyl isomerase